MQRMKEDKQKSAVTTETVSLWFGRTGTQPNQVAHRFRLREEAEIDQFKASLRISDIGETEYTVFTRYLRGNVDADMALGMFIQLRAESELRRTSKKIAWDDTVTADMISDRIKKEKNAKEFLLECQDQLRTISYAQSDVAIPQERKAIVGVFALVGDRPLLIGLAMVLIDFFKFEIYNNDGAEEYHFIRNKKKGVPKTYRVVDDNEKLYGEESYDEDELYYGPSVAFWEIFISDAVKNKSQFQPKIEETCRKIQPPSFVYSSLWYRPLQMGREPESKDNTAI